MLNLSLPLNGLSFGQTSLCILKELFNRKIPINLFPIGQPQLEAYQISAEFGSWLQNVINRAPGKYKRKDKGFKLWHCQNGWEKVSDYQGLMTFVETDQIGENEFNTLNNQDVVFATNSYTKKIFEDYGLENCKLAPLGFDSDTFYETGSVYLDNDITVWSMVGKCEIRKNTLRLLNIWSKLYGNQRNHRLNLLIHNPFLPDDVQGRQIAAALENRPYYNITFLPHLKTNAETNDFFNCSDVCINLSSAEGFDLPAIQGLGLGKTIIGTDCHAHVDYLNERNAIIVKYSGKIPANDGQFFIPGQAYNQGNFFNLTDEAIIDGLKRAEKSIEIVDGKKRSKFYNEAIKVKDQFNYQKTVDILLKHLS